MAQLVGAMLARATFTVYLASDEPGTAPQLSHALATHPDLAGRRCVRVAGSAL